MNSTDTKADALKNEPIIIRKIRRDYDRIQVLTDEKVQLAEQALKLVSKHRSDWVDDIWDMVWHCDRYFYLDGQAFTTIG